MGLSDGGALAANVVSFTADRHQEESGKLKQ